MLYYAARQVARINERERAIAILSRVLDRGFLCATAIARDPWFASLPSSGHYVALMRKAEQRRSEVHATFLAARGEQLLSVT